MHILVVEDDHDLCDATCRQLELNGYTVERCYDGMDALSYALQYSYDLFIFDRMLPELDGVTVLQKLREEDIHTPAILVTALGGLGDRIQGLDAGADDYLVKPFAIEELLARVRALLRRPHTLETDNTVSFGDLVLHISELTLESGGNTVTLSKKEALLLEYFMKNSARTLSREQLILRVWGAEAGIMDGNLDNYIHFLRRRLKAAGSSASIHTVHGMGYRLENASK